MISYFLFVLLMIIIVKLRQLQVMFASWLCVRMLNKNIAAILKFLIKRNICTYSTNSHAYLHCVIFVQQNIDIRNSACKCLEITV